MGLEGEHWGEIPLFSLMTLAPINHSLELLDFMILRSECRYRELKDFS